MMLIFILNPGFDTIFQVKHLIIRHVLDGACLYKLIFFFFNPATLICSWKISCYSCSTWMYLECARGLSCPPRLWQYPLPGFSSASGDLSPWVTDSRFLAGNRGWAIFQQFLLIPSFPDSNPRDISLSAAVGVIQ